MFSWGENTRDGFGLVKSNDLVKANTDGCVNFIHLKSPVTHLSAGNKVVAFIRNNGKVSLARMQDDKDGRRITGKLKGVECREKILALSCCDAHIILLSEEGRVFCLTQSSNVPRWVLDRNDTSLGLGRLTFEWLLSIVLIDHIVMITWLSVFSQPNVVQRILLPSLSKDPIGVEGLRVYLIIPELLRVLRKQQRGIDITEAFAAAILRLNPDKLQVLEGLWSTLSDSFFRTVVKAFHSVSAEYLQQMAVKRCDHGKSLKKTFGVLQRLYDANSKRRRRITVDTFHINKICSLFQSKLVQDLNSELRELFWDISGEDDTYWIESDMILRKIECYKVCYFSITRNICILT
ncbi:unnamed protein product [Oncorhynchus mykiss]|uniref:Uncharacterized protein n=1 Tax=Oncorhynchus mykiss TaxID=8022 RepID=A0A060Y5P6_ONCMY|nr:unnamed protein product [Oncorhynchus mykiss]